MQTKKKVKFLRKNFHAITTAVLPLKKESLKYIDKWRNDSIEKQANWKPPPS